MDTYKPDICIYHGNCDDGFAAALAVWMRWPDIEFVPAVYGKPLTLGKVGAHLLFVDFSLPRIETECLLTDGDGPCASIVILDHHKTAQAELEPFTVDGGFLSAEEIPAALLARKIAEQPPIVAVFDMEQSGAMLAWKFCHDTPAPSFFSLIEDRDLWRFKYPETKAFSAALRTYPQDFALWNAMLDDPASLEREGVPILRAHQANIEKFIAEAFMVMIGGYTVPCCNAPYHYASDTAHALLQRHPNAPFAAAWFKRGDGLLQFSLRSEDSREDVSAIAKKYGGGGHRNAAGFQYDPGRAWP